MTRVIFSTFLRRFTVTTTTADKDFDAALAEAVAELNAAAGDHWDIRLDHLAELARGLCEQYPERYKEIHTALRDACRDTGLLDTAGSQSVDGFIRQGFGLAPGYHTVKMFDDEVFERVETLRVDREARQQLDLEESDGSWQPVDLSRWRDGVAVETIRPTLGMARNDGVQLIYPGAEHSILGQTESGKTWLALNCVATELQAGHPVVYVHYEEPREDSTIERLLLLGVDIDTIVKYLRFVGPGERVRPELVTALLHPAPTLVVHDGVNEAMSLMGLGMDVDGASEFRRLLVTPFRRVGAATIACDHMPMDHDAGRVDAYGSVHKGNALDGARIMLENVEPFGRGMRGRSKVFVTKDRPGYLRQYGRPTRFPGKVYLGTLVVDATTGPGFAMAFAAPTDADETQTKAGADLATIVYDIVAAMPGHTVNSGRDLLREVRKPGHKLTDAKIRSVVDDLVATGRLIHVSGRRGANTYTAVL
jgi:hypothetical protein